MADNPLFALIQQTYLLPCREAGRWPMNAGLEPARRGAVAVLHPGAVDALNPDNFPLTNPKVLETRRRPAAKAWSRAWSTCSPISRAAN